MSFRKLYSIILAAVVIMAAVGCDKDKDTDSSPSLNGTLSFQLPPFVAPKDVLIMTPKGLTHPEGKGIGYAWRVSPGMSQSDTTRLETGLTSEGHVSDGSFRYHFPDSLGTFTVSCYGFAKGYMSSYASSYTTVVKGGLNGSIRGTGIFSRDQKISTENTSYYYTDHNGLDWFRNNLANPSYGVPYSNTDAMLTVLGNFYSYEEALKACPEGWRLPTDAEWAALAASLNPESGAVAGEPFKGVAASLMGNVSFNGTAMWEYWPSVGVITNSSRLAFIPAGYANLGERDENGRYPSATFFGIYEYSVFWTADRVADNEDMAYYRYIISDQPDMQIGKGDVRTFGANVRCVRENN